MLSRPTHPTSKAGLGPTLETNLRGTRYAIAMGLLAVLMAPVRAVGRAEEGRRGRGRSAPFALMFAVAAWLSGSPIATAACPDPMKALGVSRVIEIDTSSGALFGSMSKLARETNFLAPKEVVLTFDDGPVPRITTPILNALDAACTKATFFSVGEMALEYPGTVKDILARGHTLGTHTWTHPLSLRRLSLEKATDQIERGIAAITLAAEAPVAPFFRFPGLSDTNPLLSHLQARGIASFTVDVISNDSYIGNASRLADRVVRLTEARQGGILLFHDIKTATAKALPTILHELKERGFKVVHLRAKAPLTAATTYDEEFKAVLSKANPKYKDAPKVESPALQTADGLMPPTTELSFTARARDAAPAASVTADGRTSRNH